MRLAITADPGCFEYDCGDVRYSVDSWYVEECGSSAIDVQVWRDYDRETDAWSFLAVAERFDIAFCTSVTLASVECKFADDCELAPALKSVIADLERATFDARENAKPGDVHVYNRAVMIMREWALTF